MKNLKKVLALGLALVMLLGMFTIASAAETKKSASDLTDWNTVVHQDAVSLMVDLGIINGMPDGSFAPTGNIDRASWAKMVYYAATGSDNADAYLGSASGLNDIAGNWAESYISYLKAGKYISGDNYGNYNPTANVTVAEACKMMLTTLGYDAEDRGYQNTAAWAGNIMTDAKRNGLLDNLDSSMSALVPLTRENAAELVLNTLNANTVISETRKDQGERYIVSYKYGPTLGYDVFNMIKVTALVDEVDKDGYAVVNSVVDPEGFNVQGQLTKNVKASPSVAGEEANFYVKADGFKFDKDTGEISVIGNFKSIISSNAAAAAATPVRTFTAGVKLADVIDRTSSDYVAGSYAKNEDESDACVYYLNGKKDTKVNVGAAAALRGTVTEFYLNDAGNISVVKAYKYTVEQVESAVATKTLSDGTLQVRVPGVVNAYTDADKVIGWQGLEAEDVVLYYKTPLSGGGYAYTIEKADTVTGKVTTYSKNGTLTINGKNYKATEQDVSFQDVDVRDVTMKAWPNLADEFKFFLDKNGSIGAAIQITESMDNTKVCMVIETEVTTGSMGASGNLAANLLFVDGSTEIVKVSKVCGTIGTETKYNDEPKSVVDELSKNATTAAKQITADDAQKLLAGGKDSKDKDKTPLTKFFNYKSTSNGYELTELGAYAAMNRNRNWENAVTANGKTITKGQAAFADDFALTANANTTFIMGKEDREGNVAYTVVKGIKNLHEMNASIVTAIAENVDPAAVADVNTVAKYVYLGTDKFSDDAPDGYIFLVDNNWVADTELNDDGVALVNIIDIDGTPTTMRVDAVLKTGIANDPTRLDGGTNGTTYIRKFWAVMDVDEDKVVSGIGDGDTLNADVDMAGVKSLGGDVLELDNGESYVYDDNTKFVYVDMGWADDEDDALNKIGTREVDRDKWVISGSGKIANVETFFKASNVDDTGAYNLNLKEGDDGYNPKGATYISVDAAVITRDGAKVVNTAEYVYIVRYLW